MAPASALLRKSADVAFSGKGRDIVGSVTRLRAIPKKRWLALVVAKQDLKSGFDALSRCSLTEFFAASGTKFPFDSSVLEG